MAKEYHSHGRIISWHFYSSGTGFSLDTFGGEIDYWLDVDFIVGINLAERRFIKSDWLVVESFV
jgi:hypothetical protein